MRIFAEQVACKTPFLRKCDVFLFMCVCAKGKELRVDLRYRVPFNCFAALARSLFIGCGFVFFLFGQNELFVLMFDFLLVLGNY